MKKLSKNTFFVDDQFHSALWLILSLPFERLSRVSKNLKFQAGLIGGLRSMHTGRKILYFDKKRQ